MTVVDVPQRSPEWFAARVGRLTGSSAKDMIATIKSGEAAARRDLRVRLVVERLTGEPQEDGYVNAVIQRGIDKEADALAAYEAVTGHTVWPVGFMQHDDLMAGCSPDGRACDDIGIVEAKCPKSATHLEYLKAGKVPSGYMPQITHNLWISGAEWCDFISFDDRFPADLRLIVYRVTRSDVDLNAYELAARLFLAEVDKEVEAVKALRPKVAA